MASGAYFSRAAILFLKQREASVLAIAVILFIYFAATTTAFVSHGSFVNIAQYMAPYVIIGIGLVLLMVCGEIDLSVGFVCTFVAVPHALPDRLLRHPRPPRDHRRGAVSAVWSAGSTASSRPSSACPSLITTLATGFIIFGLTLTTSHAHPVNIPHELARHRSLDRLRAWSEIIWASSWS